MIRDYWQRRNGSFRAFWNPGFPKSRETLTAASVLKKHSKPYSCGCFAIQSGMLMLVLLALALPTHQRTFSVWMPQSTNNYKKQGKSCKGSSPIIRSDL